jgi:hypothetical protein
MAFTVWWMISVIAPTPASGIYLKDAEGTVSRFAKAMIVFRASSSLHLALLLIWGPLHFHGTTSRSFPLLFWIGMTVVYLALVGLFEGMEDMWRPHGIIVYCSVWAGMIAATVTLWYQDCQIRAGIAD